MDIEWINVEFRCNSNLVNNKMLADVKFQFADEKIILAHSFVLSLQSQEFFIKFNESIGVMKMIQVYDTSHDAFLEFIQYIYTKSIKLKPNHIYELMKLSIQYDVEHLKQKCENYIISSLTVDTVFATLNLAINEKWDNIKQLTTDYIANNYSAILNHKSFLEINDQTLKTILELNPVSDNNECAIFESVLKWTERACEKDGINLNASEQRKKLGDNLQLIRFASMTNEEFAKCMKNAPGILTKDESLSIFMNIATKTVNNFGFTNKKRLNILTQQMDIDDRVVFYQIDFSNLELQDTERLEKKFFIEFSVNKPLQLNCIFLNFALRPLTIDYVFVENDKIILKNKSLLRESTNGISNIAIENMQLNPRIRYMFEYSLLNLKPNNCYLTKCYQKNNPIIKSSLKKFAQFTIHSNDSHVIQMNYKAII